MAVAAPGGVCTPALLAQLQAPGEVASLSLERPAARQLLLWAGRACLAGELPPARLAAAARATGLPPGDAASILADVLWCAARRGGGRRGGAQPHARTFAPRSPPPRCCCARCSTVRLLSVESEPPDRSLPRARLVEAAKACLAAGALPRPLLLERSEVDFAHAVGLVPDAAAWKKQEARARERLRLARLRLSPIAPPTHAPPSIRCPFFTPRFGSTPR